MQKPVIIKTGVVKAMLGGKWPDSGDSLWWPSGFDFDSVDHFRVEGSRLVPYDGSHPLPGPDFRLEIV